MGGGGQAAGHLRQEQFDGEGTASRCERAGREGEPRRWRWRTQTINGVGAQWPVQVRWYLKQLKYLIFQLHCLPLARAIILECQDQLLQLPR